MVVVLVLLSGGAAHVGAAVIARHRAQSAADLAALAAAYRLPAGPDVACGYAGTVASRTGASVRRCDIDDLDVIVETVVPVRVSLLIAEAAAVARAGPVLPS